MTGGASKIREARPADAAAIARVQVETWHATFRDSLPADFLAGITIEARRPRWEEELNDPARASFVFVAEAGGGEVVGFASCGPERDGDAEFDGEFYAVYILEAFQRAGLGRALALAVVERLAAAGFRSMLVWALEVNGAGRRFYEKLGGRLVRAGSITRGAHTFPTAGYGWEDIARLREELGESQG
ncbi:MAG TPA: GNAT family N-acetyltransferase [Pyrinomonadaceae bacterium]